MPKNPHAHFEWAGALPLLVAALFDALATSSPEPGRPFLMSAMWRRASLGERPNWRRIADLSPSTIGHLSPGTVSQLECAIAFGLVESLTAALRDPVAAPRATSPKLSIRSGAREGKRTMSSSCPPMAST
jgi:hypothetical protein